MTKRVVTGRVAMGIDASLTGTGLVAVPFDWGLDWSRIARMTLGISLSNIASPEERVRRIDTICTRTMEFAREHAVTDVFIEDYAYNMADRSRAHATGELGGNLKRDVILGLGLPLTEVAASTARTLLGTFSARGKKGSPKPPPLKDQVHAVLRRVGLPPEWGPDEADAWVTANWGLSGIDGADALILREAA